MKTRFTANKLAALSMQELYTLARELDIAGRASLSRSELIKVLQVLLVEPPLSQSVKRASNITVPPESSDLIKLLPENPLEKSGLSKSSEENERTEPPVDKPRRGRPPKVKVEAEAPVDKPRRGRPPKVKVEAETSVERPRRGRPTKVKVEAEAPIDKPRRGRPPKVKVEAEALVDKPRRGRPPKVKVEAEASVDKPRRGRPPKVKVEAEAPIDKPRRGRPPKVKVEAAVSVEKPRRGRPPKEQLAPTVPLFHEQVPSPKVSSSRPLHSVERFNRECEEEAAALKRLNRAFGKRSEESPAHENRKGAEVLESVVAIPVNIHLGNDEKKVSSRAEQIENDRRRKHASLKTTMEIPVFSVPVYGVAAPVSEDELTGELPEYYDETRIVMQIRDPHWAHAYWELTPVERKRLELEVGIFEFAHSHFVLRLHNVSRGHTQEIKLTENARNWYIYLEDAQCVYQVELGLHSPTEGYNFIALSNLVQTPPDKVSGSWAPPVAPEPVVAQSSEAVLPPNEAVAENVTSEPATAYLTDPARVYFHSLAGEPLPHPGSSELLAGGHLVSPDSQTLQAGIPAGDSSYNLPGSLQLQMPTSPTGPLDMPGSGPLPSSDTCNSLSLTVGHGDEIYLTLAADLLVYGRAPAGFLVFFMGQQLKVRPDGSFTLRLALPVDASQQLQLTAVDPKTGQEQVVKASFVFNKE